MKSYVIAIAAVLISFLSGCSESKTLDFLDFSSGSANVHYIKMRFYSTFAGDLGVVCSIIVEKKQPGSTVQFFDNGCDGNVDMFNDHKLDDGISPDREKFFEDAETINKRSAEEAKLIQEKYLGYLDVMKKEKDSIKQRAMDALKQKL